MAESGFTILALEDIYSNRYMLVEALPEFKVIAVGTVEEFTKKLEAVKPDLILMDIMLPRDNGILVAKALREKPQTRDIPIIFVTAKNTRDDVIDGINAGGMDYLVKPIDGALLSQKVRHALEQVAVRKLKSQSAFGKALHLKRPGLVDVILTDFGTCDPGTLQRMLDDESAQRAVSRVTEMTPAGTVIYQEVPQAFAESFADTVRTLGAEARLRPVLSAVIDGPPLSTLDKLGFEKMAADLGLRVIWKAYI